MEQSEIVEGNRLIAVFMGSVRSPSGDINEDYEYYDGIGKLGGYLRNFSYHNSWDWIMPAWIKFRNINLDNKEYSEWLTSLSWYLYSSDEPIRLFERLVYAIKWYNTQTLTPNT